MCFKKRHNMTVNVPWRVCLLRSESSRGTADTWRSRSGRDSIKWDMLSAKKKKVLVHYRKNKREKKERRELKRKRKNNLRRLVRWCRSQFRNTDQPAAPESSQHPGASWIANQSHTEMRRNFQIFLDPENNMKSVVVRRSLLEQLALDWMIDWFYSAIPI